MAPDTMPPLTYAVRRRLSLHNTLMSSEAEEESPSSFLPFVSSFGIVLQSVVYLNPHRRNGLASGQSNIRCRIKELQSSLP